MKLCVWKRLNHFLASDTGIKNFSQTTDEEVRELLADAERSQMSEKQMRELAHSK